jgi:hypothetical protein
MVEKREVFNRFRQPFPTSRHETRSKLQSKPFWNPGLQSQLLRRKFKRHSTKGEEENRQQEQAQSLSSQPADA